MPRVLGEMQSSVQAWQEVPQPRTEDTSLLVLRLFSRDVQEGDGRGIVWEVAIIWGSL